MAAVTPGCPVDEGFDPFTPEFLADPYAALAGLPLDETLVFCARRSATT
ncbi:MAG TPA: hypothetical protein VE733_05150 [Streptosporangiaceae bacterium]|nr:hypothetical protein [Streptosporangiaceae bacterium]